MLFIITTIGDNLLTSKRNIYIESSILLMLILRTLVFHTYTRFFLEKDSLIYIIVSFKF